MDILVARFSHALHERRLSRELMALFTHRSIIRAVFATIHIFSVVFLFQVVGQSLFMLAGIFVAIYTLGFFGTPLSARLLRRAGVRTMMVAAIPFLMASFGMLWIVSQHPAYTLYAILAYIILIGMYKILYWVPYHVSFAHSLDTTMRGRQLATLENIAHILVIAAPLVGGLIVAGLGFEALFLAGMVGIACSVVPLWKLHNIYESYIWSYKRTFKELFSFKNRDLLLSHIGNGAQMEAVVTLWPVFIFLLIGGEYATLGAITALAMCAMIVIRSITGRLFDKWSHKRTIMIGSIVSATGWLTKLFVTAPIEIIAADTYHGAGRAVNHTTIDAMTYEQAADNGTYIDEYTALKEMALWLGKLGMLAIVGTIYWMGGIEVAFIGMIMCATVATLLTMRISQRILLA